MSGKDRKTDSGLNLISKPWQVACGVAVLWGVVVWILSSVTWADEFSKSNKARLEFKFRDWVGTSPKLDPKLKIFGFDDQVLHRLQISELSTRDWAHLIDTIGAKKPRAIIIDKIFGILPGSEDDAAALRASLERNPMVYAAANSLPMENRWRKPLDLSGFFYDPSRYGFTQDGLSPHPANQTIQSQGIFYGPDPRVAGAFKGIGHILFPGHSVVRPMIVTQAGRVVPHVGVLAQESVAAHERGLVINGRRVDLDRKGQLILNFPSVRHLYENTFSMLANIIAARSGREASNVEEGDTVLLLPLLYSGNVDMELTPVGRIPRGYVIASLMNSGMTGTWISAISVAPVVFLASALGLGFLKFGAGWAALAFIALNLTITTLGLATFAWMGVVLPWVSANVAFSGVALSCTALRIRNRERQISRLRDGLKGALSDEMLDDILRSPEVVQRDPSEHVLTLMFIDIAGFSVEAERRLPAEVFEVLKRQLGIMTALVHQHGGVVDKSLGDGMLCFFGYSYGSTAVNPDTKAHASAAVACATAIQVANLRWAQEHPEQLTLPMRIGVHTASVLVGDIGGRERIDFTVVGNGVNFAKRLESACDPGHVMLSAATFDLAPHIDESAYQKRLINIKHHDEVIEAVDVDPVALHPQFAATAAELMKRLASGERKMVRWPVVDSSTLGLATEFGPGTLVDFSKGGLSIRLPRFLSRSLTLQIELDPFDPDEAALWRAKGVSSLVGEVRWAKPDRDDFLHGILLKNLSSEQAEFLLSRLRIRVVSRIKKSA